MDVATALGMPPFRNYRNQSGHSGVVAYALLPDAIAVQYIDGSIYLYNHDCPGRRHVARMAVLAREGRGLGIYISRHIGNRFAARVADGRDDRRKPPPAGGTHKAQSSTRQNAALR
jgi:hypothetical protein